jgi:hypothetical protein
LRSLVRLRPDRQVGRVVTDVVEPALAECLDQPVGLCGAGKIDLGIGGEPAVEDPEVIGNRGYEPLMAREAR